jgi:LysR family transcriptional regulator, regulatory protein for tcuABC
MNIKQLRYFVQIVESGSLAKASRQLYIAQPALSQQMAKLEDEIGKLLLVRTSRGVTPTENGEALYHHAKFMLRHLDQAVAVARQEATALNGSVAVGFAPTTVCQVGLPLLEHLRKKYPGVLLSIVEGQSVHLEQMTRVGQLDLSVLFTPHVAPELSVEPLLEEELFLILPRDSDRVEAGRDSVTLAEIAALPLILPSVRHGLRRRRIEIEFERAGLPLDTVAEIDSLPLLITCVQRGLGVSIQPRAVTQAYGNQPSQWRCLRISDVRVTRPSYLYTLPPKKLSPCAAVVRTELQAVVHELVSTGAWQGVTLPQGVSERAGTLSTCEQ